MHEATNTTARYTCLAIQLFALAASETLLEWNFSPRLVATNRCDTRSNISPPLQASAILCAPGLPHSSPAFNLGEADGMVGPQMQLFQLVLDTVLPATSDSAATTHASCSGLALPDRLPWKKNSDFKTYTTCKQRMQAVHVPHVEGCCHMEQKALQSKATEEQEHGIEDILRLSNASMHKKFLKSTRLCAVLKNRQLKELPGHLYLRVPSAATLDPRTCTALSWLCLS